MVFMQTKMPCNDNYYLGDPPKRPRPATPKGMMDYANAMIALWQRRIEKNDLSLSMKFYCFKRITGCKKIKILALKAMTDEGFRHDEFCCR